MIAGHTELNLAVNNPIVIDLATTRGDHNSWSVAPTVFFNTAVPKLRTNEPDTRLFWLDLAMNALGFDVKRRFLHTAAHEARHAWQGQLLVQTNPSAAGYRDDEGAQPLPSGYVNATPDNNDDMRLGDCLPERAQLAAGADHGPASHGSGSDLVDSPSTNSDINFGSALHGERPRAASDVDACTANSPALLLKERDSIRFAAAIFGDPI